MKFQIIWNATVEIQMSFMSIKYTFKYIYNKSYGLKLKFFSKIGVEIFF